MNPPAIPFSRQPQQPLERPSEAAASGSLNDPRRPGKRQGPRVLEVPIRYEAADRRLRCRFPLTFDLRYVTERYTGIGQTLNVSSRGLLLKLDRPIEPGALIEVSLAWPVRLGGSTPLQLIVGGNVARSDGSIVAVAIQQWEFRTCARTERLAA